MNKAVSLLAIFLVCYTLYGQSTTSDPDLEYPQEILDVHLTQTCLFPGEVVGFGIYCSNPFFPELELSRVAFIELLSDLNVSVLRKKILLKNGAGEGEFVLPENLASGIYTVLTYTNWMKNFGEASFDRKRILIVNPDRGMAQCSDTCHHQQADGQGQRVDDHSRSGLLLMPDKEQYQTREQVTLQVKMNPEEGELLGGSFSVSVCYTEPALYRGEAEEYLAGSKMKTEEIEYLPDFGGIRLTGKLEDVSGQAKTGEGVILSAPGPGTKVSSTLSDSKGNFHFLLAPQAGEKDLVFTLPDPEAIIKLEEPYWNGFRSPPVQEELCLQENTIFYLKEKFLHFQLQQKFNRSNFSKSEQRDLSTTDSTSFYSSYSRLLKMDDYILLDSLSEYFYELVPSVRFFQSRGKFNIRVTDPVSGLPYEEKPGVFVDGVLYSNYDEIAHIPVREIEEIAVIPEVYYYGNFSFGGIIDLHTVDSDFNAVQLLPEMIRLIYPLASLPEMIFKVTDYSLPNELNRIPDFRHLIYWEPDFLIGTSGENSIQFYTSDLMGEYTITVKGISHDGRLLKSETKITVGRIVSLL
jgi:hypothetical protein